MNWLTPDDLTALAVTLKLATVTVALLIVLGTPLAWWLARTQWRGKPVIEALVALPLVLPPTVLGFYMLVLLGPNGTVGKTLESLGYPHLAFSFTGLVIGSLLFSLPFAIQPLQNAFASIGDRALEAASTLRANAWDRFVSREFGVDLKKAARESVSDRGEGAAKVVTRLREAHAAAAHARAPTLAAGAPP